jgi:predicted nucleic acid-binding protein
MSDNLKLTLDTNVLMEYWKERTKYDEVEKLLSLAEQGKVDLAVTARIYEDIKTYPLAERLNELKELNIEETGSVTRLGQWVLGRDMLGDEEFDESSKTMDDFIAKRHGQAVDLRDWDHLHAHYLLKRDVFLTWDKGIINLAKELKNKFGIDVMMPEKFLQSFKII